MLSFRVATFQDRVQSFENIFDVWRSSDDFTEHVNLRLASIHHQRADFCVGVGEERVEVSLASFPFELSLADSVESTSFVGCVHTIAESRGKGYARQLIDWTEQFESARGTSISLLFSDIKPEYYSRLGYQHCSAHNGLIDIGSTEVRDDSIVLEEFRLKENLDWVSDCYNHAHAHLDAYVHRSEFYWWFLTKKDPYDKYFAINQNGKRIGFIRMKDEGIRWKLRDCSIGSLSAEDYDRAIDGIVSYFTDSKCKEVYGWFPKTDVLADRIEISERPDEITMIKSLGDITIDEKLKTSLDYLHEIDHV